MTRLCTGCWANEHVREEKKNTRTPTIRNGERVRGGESERKTKLYIKKVYERATSARKELRDEREEKMESESVHKLCC